MFEPRDVIPLAAFTLIERLVGFRDFVIPMSNCRIFKGHQNQAPKTLERRSEDRDCDWFFEAVPKPDDFKKIPRQPNSLLASASSLP